MFRRGMRGAVCLGSRVPHFHSKSRCSPCRNEFKDLLLYRYTCNLQHAYLR